MKVDMSPEGIVSRLHTMEELWELSVALLGARSSDGKPLSTRRWISDTITDCIRKVMMDEWDPLGVQGIPEATDEYDSYIGPIHGILLGSRSFEEIVDYLKRIETEVITVCTSDAVRRGVAQKLLEINTELDQKL